MVFLRTLIGAKHLRTYCYAMAFSYIHQSKIPNSKSGIHNKSHRENSVREEYKMFS